MTRRRSLETKHRHSPFGEYGCCDQWAYNSRGPLWVEYSIAVLCFLVFAVFATGVYRQGSQIELLEAEARSTEIP